MNVQNIIVGIIVLSALIYVGLILLRKVKSFSAKNSCGTDCGCEGASKAQKQFVNTAGK